MIYDINLIHIHEVRKTFLQRILEIQKKTISKIRSWMASLSLFFSQDYKNIALVHMHTISELVRPSGLWGLRKTAIFHNNIFPQASGKIKLEVLVFPRFHNFRPHLVQALQVMEKFVASNSRKSLLHILVQDLRDGVAFQEYTHQHFAS